MEQIRALGRVKNGYFAADLVDSDASSALVYAALGEFSIDILVNNAGTIRRGFPLRKDYEH